MKWPVKVRYPEKKGPVYATIYRPCSGRSDYRVKWKFAGKWVMKALPRFIGKGGAKEFAEEKAKELAGNSPKSLVTLREATDLIVIREKLLQHKQATGQDVSLLDALSEYLALRKLLPLEVTPTEAVKSYLQTSGSVIAKTVTDAVEEFLAGRKTEVKAGERARYSPVYARNVETWLKSFSNTFSSHQVSDLTPAMLESFLGGFADLSPKSRNDRRAIVGTCLRWCGRKDYIEAGHLNKLLIADIMQPERTQHGAIRFYDPAELQKILDATRDPANESVNATSRDALCAVTALQALGGARLEEALRLHWEDLFRIPDHIEISGERAKTRARRLLEVGPALKAWLAAFKRHTGPIWNAPINSFVTEWARLRESVDVPSKKNGLRHGFVSFSYTLNGEEQTAILAGTSAKILHRNYRGLATKSEATRWFSVKPTENAPDEGNANAQGEAEKPKGA